MSDRVFLGRYRSLRLLAEGGMSRVYVALELERHREVVVKVLHDHLIHEGGDTVQAALDAALLVEGDHAEGQLGEFWILDFGFWIGGPGA